METIEAQRQKIGKQLYVAAWIVEVLAASLGLALAVIMLLAAKDDLLQQNNNAFSSGDTFTIYLAGLPFLAIAVVELLKIPFAAACYFSTTKLTKIIFGFCLFLVSILTFETFLFGLEQNSYVRLMAINEIKDKQTNHKKERKDLEEIANQLRSRGTKADIERENKKALGIINTEEEEEIRRIDKLIEEFQVPVDLAKNDLKTDRKNIHKDIKENKVLIRDLQKQLRDIQSQSEIDTKKEEKFEKFRETSIDHEKDSYLSKKKSNQKSLEQTKAKIGELETKIQEKCKWYTSFDCTPLKDELKKQRNKKTELETKVNISLAGKIDKFNNDYNQAIKESRQKRLDQKRKDEETWKEKIKKQEQNLADLKNKHQDLISKLHNFNQTEVFQKAQKQKDKLKAEKEEKRNIYGQKRRDQKLERNKLIAEYNDKENNLRENEKKQNELKDKITKLENKFDREARGNQFYRFAMIFIPGIQSPSDVTNQHISLVAQVWFISLAGIIAWMGTLLAFASFVVRYGPSSSEAKIAKAAAKAEKATAKAAVKAANAKSSKLRRCFRLLFIEARKYIRQPKIKEIEKVVEKIVEVEKEIVVEKIVPTEVIKEVPVDRVVIQNVPTEVIRKEVIHVPIASDDLTILDVKKIKPATKGQREDLSKENPEKGEK